MASETVELVRRGYEAWSHGDLDAVGRLLAGDVKWHGGDEDAPGACRGREQVLRFMRMRDVSGFQVLDLIDAGDRVVVLIQPPAHQGATPPPRANVTTVREGRVAEMVAYESPEAALAAAGVRPSPDREA